MDGFDIGGIFEMLRPMLPTISYFVNMITKLFEIFTSYLGFDINASTPEDTTAAAE